jgi:release factor glutamine methyltransferase
VNPGEPLTVRRLWAQTADAIGSRHEARWLVEVATGLDPTTFQTSIDEPVTERMVTQLDTMVARYRTGEPIQYVLGRWEFRRVELAVDRRVLIPRPETELVAGAAIELAAAAGPPRLVADLGTGSGAIGLAIATELPLAGTTVWLTDVSADALDVARANLAGIGRAAVNVRIAEGGWFEALPADARGSFDVLVSNPPYVADGAAELAPDVLEWEPASALLAGPDGLADIRELVAGAPEWLADDGWLVLEVGADQGAAVARLLAEAGYRDVEIRPDLAGHDRIAVARRPGQAN